MANMELQKSIKNYQDKTRDKTAQFEAEQQAKVIKIWFGNPSVSFYRSLGLCQGVPDDC